MSAAQERRAVPVVKINLVSICTKTTLMLCFHMNEEELASFLTATLLTYFVSFFILYLKVHSNRSAAIQTHVYIKYL